MPIFRLQKPACSNPVLAKSKFDTVHKECSVIVQNHRQHILFTSVEVPQEDELIFSFKYWIHVVYWRDTEYFSYGTKIVSVMLRRLRKLHIVAGTIYLTDMLNLLPFTSLIWL